MIYDRMSNKKIKTEKNLKINTGKDKGITLIALVLTIIILLILASISIGMLAGENGILKQATQAKEETEYGQIQEEVSMTYMEVLTDHYNSNYYEFASSFQETLRNYNNQSQKDTVTYEPAKDRYKIYYKDRYFEISTESGNVTTVRQDEKDQIADVIAGLPKSSLSRILCKFFSN